ncbi:conserved protein of unknown function (plasmid) [Cupriavidus taiwanensis]|uniref:Uncharacterized protein n=1 Tax=Cupriavidus taiwanensis TaxID=164546 RepID=A0A9Q7XTR9_9BURK|nr:conserved protein of unknown function [Cupriavidus taiwanensis]
MPGMSRGTGGGIADLLAGEKSSSSAGQGGAARHGSPHTVHHLFEPLNRLSDPRDGIDRFRVQPPLDRRCPLGKPSRGLYRGPLKRDGIVAVADAIQTEQIP